MKKKSIAALMATVMVITSVFSGPSSVMAADLFSDGNVQSVESADDWNDVPLEEEAFLSETTVTGSAENQSGEHISETTVQNGNESVSNMAENPLQMDTDVETENSENTNPEITIEEIGENEEATDVEELEKTTVPEEAGNSSDGENFSGQTAQEEWSDGIEENQVLSMPSDTNTNADIVNSGTSGENVTWTLDSEGTLTISGTGTVSNNWRDNVNYRTVKKIIINEGITGIGGSVFRECNQLIQVSLPSGLKTIGAGAFDSCQQLQQINLPLGLTAIEEETFNYCISLGEIDIPSSVTTIGNKAFWDCQNLEKVNFSKGITSIGDWAFRDCKKLKQINLPYGVTDIGDLAFENCQGLEEAYIPSSVITIGNAAFQSSGLIKAEIPSSVKSLGESIFNTCKSLREVKLPEGITEIPDEMFAACALERIDIPDSVTVIGDGAFNLNFSLKEIEIPEMVTIIGAYAFNQCYALESIIIPANVEVISSDAFSRCSSLNNIVFEGNKPSIGTPFVDVTANGYFPPDNPTWAGITSSWGGGTFRWNVKPIDVSLDQEVYAYTGGEIRPSVTVTCEGKVLAEGENYSLSYSNNIEVGTATVTVTGTGNYGSASVDFQITDGNDIRFCLITMDESVFVYTGAEIEPKVTLTADYGKGDVLVPGVDYNISFGTNKAPGRGMVFLEGTGSYTGRKTLTFDILPRKTDFDFVDENGEFRRVGKFQMTWDAVPEADGYEIVYYRTDKESDEDAWTRVTIDGCENTSAEYVVPGGLEYHVEINAYHDLVDSDEKVRSEITAKTVKVLPTAGDMWGFGNPVLEGSEVMGYAEYETFFSTAAVDAMFNKEILTNGANGICYGLDRAALEILLDGNPELSSLGVDSLYDVKEWGSLSAELRQKIRLDQIYQYVFLQTGDCQYEIPQILDKMDHYLETGQDPVILAVFMDDLGHALTALDYTTDTNGDICIRVYDSNWPGDEDRYVKLSGPDYSTWYYDPGWGEPWHGSTGTTYDENHVEEHTFFAYGNAVSSGGQDVLIVDTSKTDGELDLQYFNNIKVILPAAVAPGSASAIPEGVSAYWIDRQDSYTIPNLPAGAKVAIASGNCAVEVTASESCDLVMSVGDDVENSVQVLSGKASSVETSFSRYSGTKKEVMSFASRAEAGTALKMTQMDTAVKLSGLTGLKMNQDTFTRDDDAYIPMDTGNELSADSLQAEKEYLIGENISGDGSTALMEDTDGDGQADTVISVIQKAVDLSSCTLSLSASSFVYDGTEKKPAVTVKNGSEILVKDTDYEVSYSNNRNAGTASVTVTGKGRTQGTISAKFAIQAAPVSGFTVALSFSRCTYTGAEQKPGVTVKKGNMTLKNGTDYTVVYANNINAGTGIITITGKGNYSGTVKKNFTIDRASVSDCSIALSATRYYYNGNAFKPGVTVKKGSAVLKNGTHYTVAYSGNVNIGTATAIVTGKGNYTGTVRKSYTITTAVGRVYTVGAFKYRVTNANVNGTGTLALIAPKSRYYTGVTIPATAKIGGVNFKVTTIYLRAFRNCRRLKKVIVGNNVTTICHYAFQGCTNLQYIALGSRVKVIGKYAFYGDKKLKGITIKSRYIRSVGTRAFRGIYSRAVIKMPRAKYTSYKRLFRGKGLSSRVTYRRY